MRCITEAECLTWCRNRDFDVAERLPRINHPRAYIRIQLFGLTVADEAAALYVLRHEREIPSSKEVLLWIREWGIFADEDFQTMLKYMRYGIGETKSLADCPGLVIPTSSFDLIEALVVLSVLARWDALLVPSIPGYSIEISHADFIEIYCQDEAFAQEILSDLETLKGSKITTPWL